MYVFHHESSADVTPKILKWGPFMATAFLAQTKKKQWISDNSDNDSKLNLAFMRTCKGFHFVLSKMVLVCFGYEEITAPQYAQYEWKILQSRFSLKTQNLLVYPSHNWIDPTLGLIWGVSVSDWMVFIHLYSVRLLTFLLAASGFNLSCATQQITQRAHIIKVCGCLSFFHYNNCHIQHGAIIFPSFTIPCTCRFYFQGYFKRSYG